MSRVGGAAQVWCSLYTLAVPAPERTRRRDEVHSHLYEARVSWGGGWRTRARLALGSARGAIADLQWCDEVRHLHGQPPLLASAVIGSVGPNVVAGLLIAAAFVLTTVESVAVSDAGGLAAQLAAMVVTTSLVARWLRRRRMNP